MAALLAGGAAAQTPGAPRSGTIEIGAFGQYTWFDGNAGRLNAVPEDGFGYGGRLGFFLTPALQLEADGYYSPQDRNPTESFCCTGAQPTLIEASALALRLNYNMPLGAFLGGPSQFILGAGAVRTNYRFSGGTGEESSSADLGLSGLAGLRMGIAGPLALRLDGVADYMPGQVPEANLNLHARAGLSLLFGTAGALMPVAIAPPPPPPPPAAPLPLAEESIRVCVVQGGTVRDVDAIYIPSRGDTVVMMAGERRAFASAYPSSGPDYAGGEGWFINNTPARISDREYVRVGLPRVMRPGELSRVTEYNGVTVFAESGGVTPHPVLYVPLRPGCEFQAYQLQTAAAAVRG